MGKIFLNELTAMLAEKHNTDKRKVRKFINSISEVIQDGLTADKAVKIKGLGTFKIVEVDARESVHVNTGQRLVIEGHSKIAFLPDNAMKELVNKPFSVFETVVLNEGVSFDDMNEGKKEADTAVDETDTAIEETDTIIEENDTVVEEMQDTYSETDVKETEPLLEISEEDTDESLTDDNQETPEHDSEETVQEIPYESMIDIVEEPIAEDANVEDTTIEEPAEEQFAEEATDEELTDENTDTLPRSRKWIWGTMLAGLLIVIGLGAWYFLKDGQPSATPASNQQKPTATATVTKEPAEEKAEATTEAETPEKAVKEDVPSWEKYNDKDIRVHEGAYFIMGCDSVLTIKKGDTVKRIAKHFFGSEDMSCYIEVFNDIKATDALEPGSTIKIPKIEKKSTVRKRLSNSNQQ